jgi:hypothetical protein
MTQENLYLKIYQDLDDARLFRSFFQAMIDGKAEDLADISNAFQEKVPATLDDVRAIINKALFKVTPE